MHNLNSVPVMTASLILLLLDRTSTKGQAEVAKTRFTCKVESEKESEYDTLDGTLHGNGVVTISPSISKQQSIKTAPSVQTLT
ncbi:unnamed protein product [Hymenolepis diminuta]|uniref:Uncharacterized protein n=1 Tax=Hymenolepis diminuta TaxID=6216 RepID=A0A564XYA6_HYMDI|nr:unnamed protein product [Hymenolepis diminuta]